MCASGKRTYPNGCEAHREARKLAKNNKAARQLKPYRCPLCSQFHLANGIRERRNDRYERYRESREGYA
jgi:hypothetical protein